MSREKGAFQVDLEKCYFIHTGTVRPTLRRTLRLWIWHFGLHCVAVYRFGRFADRLRQRCWPVGLLAVAMHRLLDYQMKLLHNVHIDDAVFGPGLYIGHAGTIFVGPTTVGRNFSIHHNVTIGVGHSDGKDGIPVIGDDVWVGTASVLAGAIAIGNQVTVSSGSIVTRSIPDRCFVAGNPARVLIRDYDNSLLFGVRESARQGEDHRQSP